MILGYKVLASHVQKWFKQFLSPANEVWGKLIFLQACVIPSVHRGEGSWLPSIPECITGHMTRGVYTQTEVCIRGGLHPRRGLGRLPPSDTTAYGQQAGGTHPTWMHSCFKRFSSINVYRWTLRTPHINQHCKCQNSVLYLKEMVMLLSSK